MAKEGIKAREVKRAKLVAKFAEKLPEITKLWINCQKMLLRFVYITVAN